MPGKAAQHLGKLDSNRAVEPARQRIVSHNGVFAIVEIPEGGLAISVRLDSPYIRYDFPIEEEVLRKFGQAATAPRVQQPTSRITVPGG